MPLERLPGNHVELSLIAAQYRSSPLAVYFYQLNTRLSMLHADTLALLYHLARYGGAPVLELGPFIGGATIAIAKGLAEAALGHKVVSVELGGASDHVTHATPDIVASFRSNLAQQELAAQSELVVGYSRDASVVAEVGAFAAVDRFGCLLIDSDGHVGDDIERYGALLRPHAFLVVDDYYSPGAPDKELTTRHEVDALAERGVIEPWGVHGWGTWFGRFR